MHATCPNLLSLASLLGSTTYASNFLKGLPSEFPAGTSKWAWVSYESSTVAVIPGSSNRSIFDAPYEGEVSNSSVHQAQIPYLAEQFSSLIRSQLHSIGGHRLHSYDTRFPHIIGSDANIEHVQHLANEIHEAPCYNPATGDLFFAGWGLLGRDWQYLLNTRRNTLHKIQTDPPIHNVH